MRLFSLTALFVVLCLIPARLQAQEEVDYLGLAAMLIKNGYMDRAETTLDKINLKEDPVDLSQYRALRGMIALSKKQHSEAETLFLSALENEEADREIYLYLAEAQYSRKDYLKAEASLLKADPQSRKTPGFFILYANILWSQGKKDQAWEVLRKAPSQGVAPEVLLKQQFQFVLEEGLYHTARELIFLAVQLDMKAKDIATMAGLLREKQQVRLAIAPLEWAKLKWPQSTEVLMELAYCYLKEEKELAAAMLLEAAARSKPELASEAVELLRHARKPFRAEVLLSLIQDESKELRQRVGIYLGKERYDLVAYLSGRLSQAGLLQDEELRYALAYSFYVLGDFEKAQWHLSKIAREDLFAKALEIRKSMEDCRETPWVCHENL